MLEEMAAPPVNDTEFKYDAYKRANALLAEDFNEDRAHPIDNWSGANPHSMDEKKGQADQPDRRWRRLG
ncbi:hypothetical protein [Pseudomonas mandelii]|uniref:hypothetical protein n=1 Tax=Pseudomonas mandelii TaxID=75612 RepID=UPI003F59A86D